jgi:hypothetical protein
VRISGGWYAHRVTLDAAAGVYDSLRRKVRLAPGDNQLQIKNIDIANGGEAIAHPPESELNRSEEFLSGEVAMWPVSLNGPDVREPVPPLDELVVAEDMSLENVWIRDLLPEAYTSNPVSS